MAESLQLNLWSVFYAGVSIQGIFITGILLAVKKGNRIANRLLALLMLLLTLYLTDVFMSKAGLFYKVPHLLYIGIPLWYLFAPLSYFYVRYLLSNPVRWKWRQVFHLVPFVLILERLLPFYGLPADIKIQFWTGAIKPPGGSLVIFSYAMISPIQLFLYSSFILRTIQKYKIQREPARPAIGLAHLSWLKLFFGLIAAFAVFEFLMYNYHFITGERLLIWTHIPLAIFSLILYGVAYLAIIRPEVLFPVNLIPRRNGNGYHIDEDQAKKYAGQLLRIMETEKPFLDAELKYSELAARVGISARYLTEILNREIGQSFNDFVNGYRVKEVQKRLLNKENGEYTLLAIALDAGFSNKASFNRIFKKHTGQTPSQFLAAHQSPQPAQ